MSDSINLEEFTEQMLSGEEGSLDTDDLFRALMKRVEQDCSDVDYVLHMFSIQMIYRQQKCSGVNVDVTLAFEGDRVNAK